MCKQPADYLQDKLPAQNMFTAKVCMGSFLPSTQRTWNFIQGFAPLHTLIVSSFVHYVIEWPVQPFSDDMTHIF